MSVSERLEVIKKQILEAEIKYHRLSETVALLAVSKKQSPDLIREAFNAGQKSFAENYLQEAIDKQEQLKDCEIDWHFIGTIQANKTKLIASHFNWVHSVNRFKIAKRLNEQRPDFMPPLNICIEVNISKEKTKSGVLVSEIEQLLSDISHLNRLRIRGLMVIPEHQADFEKQKQIFEKVALLQKDLIARGFDLDTLSMGMSQDFEAAIAAGSTIVRIGTAIFGERH